MDTQKFRLDVPGALVEDYARNVSVMHSVAGEGISCAKAARGTRSTIGGGAEGLDPEG
jgi:hypothetical protein